MQKYIGNIIVNKLNYKTDDCFKKCLSIFDIDKTLPTLIIGINKAKELISDFNILKREYSENMIWWTLSKNEKRIDYDKNINDFYNFCITKILEKVEYRNIDIFGLSYSKIKRCLNYVKNDAFEKRYYVDNNKFVFLYDKNYVYGFSLNTAAFLGIDKRKIISMIDNNNKNKRIDNFYSIPNKIKKIIDDDIPSEMILAEYFT